MKFELALVGLVFLISHTACTSFGTKTTTKEPRSEVSKKLAHMKMSFPAIASLSNISLPDLLKKTWFQIVGATPDRMKTLGLFHVLPLTPSDALIRLLDTTTIAQLNVSHKIITNHPTLVGKNYSYATLDFLFASLTLDTQEQTVQTLKMLPVGNKSVAPFLDTTDKLLQKRRYLSDVYSKIKSILPKFLKGSVKPYYEKLRWQQFSLEEFKQFMGKDNFAFIEEHRSKYAMAVTEMAKEAEQFHWRAIESKRSHVLLQKRTTLYDAFLSPLKSGAQRCGVHRVQNATVSEVLKQCINVSRDFPLSKVHFIKNVALLKGFTTGAMASYLKMPFQEFSKYTISEILQLSASSQANVVIPLAIAATKNGLGKCKLNLENLLDFGSKVKMIPDPKYLLDMRIRHNLRSVLLEELPKMLTKRFKKQVTLNWVYITPYSYLMKAFVSSVIDSKMTDNMYNGLTYVWKSLSIANITQLFCKKLMSLNKQTLITFASNISSISHQDFFKLFKIQDTNLNLYSVNAANMANIGVLLKFNQTSRNAESYTPSKLAKWLVSLPLSTKYLLVTMEDVAKPKGIELKDLTLLRVQQANGLSDADLNRLLKIINVPRKFFDSMKGKPLNALSRIIHTPLETVGKFHMINVLRTLCSSGHRFNGSSCIPFSGCSSMPTSVCKKNAECQQVIGSYDCRCKKGYTGDGITCDKEWLTTGAKVGIAVGAVILVSLVIAGVCWCKKRKK